MADVSPSGVPFQEAIDYFRQKQSMPTKSWTDLWEGMHARAFVVAGATKAELLADLRAAVDKAIAEGTTITEFRKDFDAAVQKHGWDYKGKRGWRTQVIFNTNLRMAYAAGKWQQAVALKDRRPYLRYVAILDVRTRPMHRDWHGTVLPIDDGWWGTHYPPCGWGCRCTVQSLGPRDLARYGYEVTKPAPTVEWVDKPVPTPDGTALVKTPKGIDPGFGYNVGQAAMGYGEQRMAMEQHGRWEALEAPGGRRPANPPPLATVKPRAAFGPRANDAEDMRHLFRQAVGGDTVTLTDPLGDRVALTQALVDHILDRPNPLQDGRESVFPLLPELVTDPTEIWVGWARNSASGRVAIRRRYIGFYNLGKDRVVPLVCDLDKGVWSGLTTVQARPPYLATLRSGLRVYERGGEKS